MAAPREKTPVPPRHHLTDWMNFINSPSFKVEVRQLPISQEELSLHCKAEDMWMSFGNKVYDITSYVPYHPGGTYNLMQAAGKDGMALFNKYHRYINLEGLIGKCCIGVMEDASSKAPSLQPIQESGDQPVENDKRASSRRVIEQSLQFLDEERLD